MFRIEDLLNLFQDDVEVMKIISSAYVVSQRENKKISDSVFQQLLFLKSIQPNIYIKVNCYSNDASNYSSIENTIYLNGFFDEITFLHELTHLFSYYYSKFEIPQEYIYYKKNFLLDLKNISNVIFFLNFCKEEKQKFLKLTSPSEIEKNKINLSNDCLERKHDYSIICHIEDIIDSIYGGKSHDYGLTYIKDYNNFPQKSSKSAGHGCEYYTIPGNDFEEIIADYQAINLIAPQNDLFNIMKSILGDDFIAFLDNRCQMINGEKLIEQKIEDNTIKK